MTLFYGSDVSGNTILLDVEQSRHLSQVLRLKVGDTIKVTDGKGVMYTCEVIDPSAKGASVRVVQRDEDAGRGYYLCVAVAPTKNIDRFEWFLEKATEMGIDRVVPILCEHSERKIVRQDRCEKVVLSAAKQSYKSLFPVVDELTKLENFLKSLSEDIDERFIAHCDPAQEKVELAYVAKSGAKSVVLIGPEGDFSDAEVELAYKYGFKSVWLGRQRLRTETAALYSTALLAIKNT